MHLVTDEGQILDIPRDYLRFDVIQFGGDVVIRVIKTHSQMAKKYPGRIRERWSDGRNDDGRKDR